MCRKYQAARMGQTNVSNQQLAALQEATACLLQTGAAAHDQQHKQLFIARDVELPDKLGTQNRRVDGSRRSSTCLMQMAIRWNWVRISKGQGHQIVPPMDGIEAVYSQNARDEAVWDHVYVPVPIGTVFLPAPYLVAPHAVQEHGDEKASVEVWHEELEPACQPP